MAEQKIAKVWGEVLGYEQVSIHDEFFTRGGHSLLATRLVSRLRNEFHVDVPLGLLFTSFPTVASLAEYIENSIGRVQEVQIPLADRKQALPLSFAQQRLWFFDQFVKGSAVYNIPTGVKFKGSLDDQALKQCFQEIVRRHEVLRTSFRLEDNQPIQSIVPEMQVPLVKIDLRFMPESELQAEFIRLSQEEAVKPFDLSEGPLLRTTLLQMKDDEYVLLLTMHHIISDGWSMNVVMSELTVLYEAFVSGGESPLPELKVQYGDFAVWQRDWLVGEVLEGQLSYWQKKLDGELPVLQLPFDEVRPPVQTYHGAVHEVVIPKEMLQRLKIFSQSEGVTIFMTLLAAFKTLLYRYSGQEDIIVGSPIANRNRIENENLIGFFANTLALRSQVAGLQSFRDFLQSIRQTVAEASDHQDLPFEKLVEELHLERDMSHTPVFQVMFVLHDEQMQALDLPNVEAELLSFSSGTAKFDMTMILREFPEGLSCGVEYNRDLFKEETITRMVDHFLVLLGGILEDADFPLNELPLLSVRERELVMEEWNDTDATVSDALLHTLFMEQVPLRKQQAAVVSDRGSLTYEELAGLSNRVGHLLRRQHVQTNQLVAVVMHKGWQQVVAVLGILQSGAAYLPLDPSLPKDRLWHVLKQAEVRHVLTQSAVDPVLDWPNDVQRYCVDAEDMERWPITPLSVVQQPNDLAYVIFTSGSTGLPKGVAIDHRGAVNTILDINQRFAVGPADCVLAVSSLSFDLSVYDMFGTLASGGTIVIPDHSLVQDPTHLIQQLHDLQVTIWNSAPPLLKMLSDYALVNGMTLPSSLRLVLLSGDWIPLTLPEQLREMVPSAEVISLGGATEASIWSILYPIREVGSTWKSIPYGRPMVNQKFYVLNEALECNPVGVPGGLYIGGIGLAVEYWRDVEKTAASFIRHPKTGERLYRTGDQGRYMADGTIEFLGRLDNQVKIRGFRIELGEIEVLLTNHELVREAVVIVREDVPGDKRLVAYVVPKEEAPLDTKQLIAYLKEKLPNYAIPSDIVVMEQLPLSSNGKLDRRALPAPARDLILQQRSFVDPVTAVEQELARIWAEFLGVEAVGLHDNFFDLGGHSLLATQVFTRIHAHFHVHIPLRTIFETADLFELAQSIENDLQTGRSTQLGNPMIPVQRAEHMPLSFAQERLWILDQMEPGSHAYNISDAIKLTGHLDVAALEHSFREVIRRHESLRTSIRTVNGMGVQSIEPDLDWTMSVVDLGHMDNCEREAALRDIAQMEARQGFDLAQAPLFRVKLFKLGEAEHVLLLTLHHIIADGWSIGVLIRDIKSLYEGLVSGGSAELPALPVQYADYAQWHRNWLKETVLQDQLAYWKDKLVNIPPVLEIPTSRPRPAVQTYEGATRAFTLEPELAKQLKALSSQEGVTLYMTLLAAFKTLLYRYTGQEDILIGTPVANRKQVEIEGLIGFFVNTIIMRSRLTGEITFRQLLQQVRDVSLEAFAHQDMPFEKLVEEFHLERDLSYSPLFQVMFALQENVIERSKMSDLELSLLPLSDTATSKFDLTFTLEETQDGLRGWVEYSTALFDLDVIERMIVHYQTLLQETVADPDQQLKELPFLSEAERHQLLIEWNETQVVYPESEMCIHHLFERQATRNQEQIAVVSAEGSLTYRELNERANCLAYRLQQSGVRAETLVGLCMDRSLEMVIGMLGILKAGGAYLPLDPTYPVDRIAFMLEDSQASVLVTKKALQKQLPFYLGSVVCMDEDHDSIVEIPTGNPDVEVSVDQLAYVIYTSGSTGKPKGVQITHRSVVNHNIATAELYDLQPQDRILQFSSISFDIAVEELFPSFMVGATVLLREDHLQTAQEFTEWTARNRITVLNLPTAYWNEWIHALSRMQEVIPETVRLVAIGGEAVLPSALELWSQVAGEQVDLFNAYGPTEATVTATAYRVTMAKDSQLPFRVPIGRPIANTKVYILDQALQPVPVGVPGELHIGGAGLASGYLNRPDVTNEKFITNPFIDCEEERLYKTGDLVRYLKDGNIEFIDRLDHQVKIRGFRIEFGEVESVLLSHPQVFECVVNVHELRPGHKLLVAYWVKASNTSPTEDELRQFMKNSVPAYMAPSLFVELETLPLTPNGKVDRQALLSQDLTTLFKETEFVEPRTDVERSLASIWANVLGVEQASIYDSFFEAGGHSLLAIQLVSRIREVLGVEVRLTTIFEAPTIASLAERIDMLRAEADITKLSTITPIPRDQELPLSFAQERIWFMKQLDPDSSAYHIPAAVRLKGKLSVQLVERSFQEIVRRHEVLRTRFREVEGRPSQVIDDALFKMSVVDLRALEQHLVEQLMQRKMREEIERPFDLANDSLLRVALLQLDEQDHVVLMTMHHIISDAWSIDVLMQEFVILYTAYWNGQTAELPELPLQFADYAVWQKNWLEGDTYQRQLSYWQQTLSGTLPILELPTDQAQDKSAVSVSKRQSLVLPSRLVNRLREMSSQEDATLFMTMLTAFNLLLYRLSAQDDIIVGVPIANRNRLESEAMIGLFLNTLAIRTDLSGNPTFRALLHRVRSTMLGAYVNQDLPFEKLVEELQPERNLSRNPIFDVMVNYINTPGLHMELPGIEVDVMEVPQIGSKFMMTLYIEERVTEIDLHVVYADDLFYAERMEELLHQFHHLLEQIAEHSDQAISTYTLVTTKSRHLLPDPSEELPEEEFRSVTEMFLQWAERVPGQVAVSHRNRSLAYADLADRAMRLASLLRRNGVEGGSVVAIVGRHSFGFVASMLGVCMSGGIMLPIDQNLPRQRQELMLREAGARYLVWVSDEASAPEQGDLAFEGKSVVVTMEDGNILSDGIEFEYSAFDVVDPAPNDAAYIFFTSGTTGVPKGVLGTHKGLSHFLNWQRETFDISPADRVAQLIHVSFDAVLRDVFLPLTSGATLCLPDAIDDLGAESILPWLERERITVIHSVPSLANIWSSYQSQDVTLGALRWLFLAGEPLTDVFVARWRAAFPKMGQIVNLYGPTETTMIKCYYLVPSRLVAGSQPAGWTMPQTQALVFAEHSRICGIGEVGEIVLRTPYRTRGYINVPQAARKQFVPNPFRQDEQDLLYFTGDKGRYRPDGSLEVLGRIDDQVKVRGVRVQLNDISATLLKHPAVDSCVVVDRKDEMNQTVLIAYVVVKSEYETDRHDLRAFLEQRLMLAMVPSLFVFLEALPLTSNGKVNRKALPEPELKAITEEHVAPRTQTEELLADVWSDVLRIDRPSVLSNFFEVGGHSLLATQVMSRVQQVFDIDLSLRSLFEAPTIAQLA
ncbi:MAG: amino acid adenylation domain-containing protein, partial [Tumebacillaceae bacterium]